MKRLQGTGTVFVLFFLLFNAGPAFGQSIPRERAARLLFQRAAGPGLFNTKGKAPPSTLSGHLLWRFNGGDNAECVRSIPDVNGNGTDDVIVGFGMLQSDQNLYCINGGSSGSGSVVWKIETTGGASGGYFWGDQCLSISRDVNGDGFCEVLAGTAGGGRTANLFDGDSGDLIWQLDTYKEFASGWIYSIREIDSLNGDEIPEVIFGCGSDNNSIYCVDGSSIGTSPRVLWSCVAPDVIYSVAPIQDVDGDGFCDVLAGGGDSDDRIYCLTGGMGIAIWAYRTGGTVWCVESMADVNGDGHDDAIAAVWNPSGAVICLDGLDGSPIWSNTTIGKNGMKVVPIPDINGDAKEDVVVGSWLNAIICLSGADGTELWRTFTGTDNGGDVWSVAKVADLNADGMYDIAAASFDGKVYCLSGAEGSVFWAYNTGNRVFSVDRVGDLNGDGREEVIAGTQDTVSQRVVYCIEGDSGIPVLSKPVIKIDKNIGGPGAPVRLMLYGPPGNAYTLGASTGAGPLYVPGLGTFCLSLDKIFFTQSGTLNSTGYAVVEFIVPDLPNTTIFLQAVTGSAPGVYEEISSGVNLTPSNRSPSPPTLHFLANTPAPGKTLTLRMEGKPGYVYHLAGSTDEGPLIVYGFGRISLNTNKIVYYVQGQFNWKGKAEETFTIPAGKNQRYFFQFVTQQPPAGFFEHISNGLMMATPE